MPFDFFLDSRYSAGKHAWGMSINIDQDPLKPNSGFNEDLNYRDNYSKPIRGMAHFHFAYPWFITLHFAHLRLVLLAFHNPPLCLPLEKHIFRQKQI